MRNTGSNLEGVLMMIIVCPAISLHKQRQNFREPCLARLPRHTVHQKYICMVSPLVYENVGVRAERTSLGTKALSMPHFLPSWAGGQEIVP